MGFCRVSAAVVLVAFFATGTTRAGDGKATPLDCAALGAAFVALPSTESCLAVVGTARLDAQGHAGGRVLTARSGPEERLWRIEGTGPPPGRFALTARAGLDIDLRTASEFGTLRTVTSLAIERTAGGTGGDAPAVYLDAAYIELGMVTVGRRQSFFDYIGTNDRWYALNPTTNRPWPDAKVDLLAVTRKIEGALAVTASLEWAASGYRGRNGIGIFDELILADMPNALRTRARDGLVGTDPAWPDLVFSAILTETWGSVQVMSALHRLENDRHRSYLGYSPAGTTVGWGSATGAGATINLPMLGDGDRASLQVVRASGATAYAAASLDALGNFGADALFGWSGRLSDLPDGALKPTKAQSIAAGYRHFFSPRWELAVTGGYVAVNGYRARDFALTDLGGDLLWRPVPGFMLGAALEWRRLDFTPATRSAFSGKPGPGEYNPWRRRLRDAHSVTATVRAERTF